MRIPEKLYQLGRKDAGNLTPRIVWYRLTGTAATATSISVTFTNNNTNRILVMTTLCLNAVPGAAQSHLFSTVTIQDKDGNTIARIVGDSTASSAAARQVHIDRQGWWPLPPTFTLVAQSTFDAGANANNIGAFAISGVEIPAGTLIW